MTVGIYILIRLILIQTFGNSGLINCGDMDMGQGHHIDSGGGHGVCERQLHQR